ncbi:MAG: SIMPL domain-containing protein [Pirellulales bacterium]
MRFNLTTAFATLCMLLLCSCASAQMGPMVPGLSATATESVSLQPDGLRLAMKIQAVGKDAKSAVKALNEQREIVRKELTAMNATADSIRFSATEAGSGTGNDNEARMFRSMRMGGPVGGPGGAEDEEPTLPRVFTATCWVVAKWTIPSKDADALALLPAMLRGQITARDLEGKKRKPDLDAEQLEQYEQMAQMMEQQMSYSSSDMQTVRIEFFARVPDEVLAKTTATAFDRAKKQAEVLSKAAGTNLGKIHSVMSDPRDSMREMYRSWGGSGTQSIEAWLKSEENVEYSTSLDSLHLSVSVWLGYSLD